MAVPNVVVHIGQKEITINQPVQLLDQRLLQLCEEASEVTIIINVAHNTNRIAALVGELQYGEAVPVPNDSTTVHATREQALAELRNDPKPPQVELPIVDYALLSKNITDMPKLVPHVEYLRSAGIALVGELCMVPFRQRGGTTGQRSVISLCRDSLATLGIPTDFFTSLSKWKPWYWCSADFYSGLNTSLKEGFAWRGLDEERFYRRFKGTTMGEYIQNGRRDPTTAKHNDTGQWNISALREKQRHLNPTTGLRAAMLIPPTWNPTTSG